MTPCGVSRSHKCVDIDSCHESCTTCMYVYGSVQIMFYISYTYTYVYTPTHMQMQTQVHMGMYIYMHRVRM